MGRRSRWVHIVSTLSPMIMGCRTLRAVNRIGHSARRADTRGDTQKVIGRIIVDHVNEPHPVIVYASFERRLCR